MTADNISADQQDQLLLMMLIQQHQQIGMMGLGKIKNPATDQIERELASAKYAIDTLNALKKFTAGNLPKELEGYLDQTLTNLRLNYADEAKKGDTDSSASENSSDE
ncbi:MAG: DUF1844 domain-containing protein [Balneola sp.]|nr:MAG: DUF1844 domain-containing protein [Balneola sp.]